MFTVLQQVLNASTISCLISW